MNRKKKPASKQRLYQCIADAVVAFKLRPPKVVSLSTPVINCRSGIMDFRGRAQGTTKVENRRITVARFRSETNSMEHSC